MVAFRRDSIRRVANRIVHFLDSDLSKRLMALGVIISLGIGINTSYVSARLTRCQLAYSDSISLVFAGRDDLEKRDRESEDRMWQAFRDAGKMPPAEGKRHAESAFNRFIAERMEIARELQEHPLPSPPSQHC